MSMSTITKRCAGFSRTLRKRGPSARCACLRSQGRTRQMIERVGDSASLTRNSKHQSTPRNVHGLGLSLRAVRNDLSYAGNLDRSS